MASVIRYLATVSLAAIITLSAFYLMHRLIDHEGAAPVSLPSVTSIRFGPVDIPEPPAPDRRTPPDKPERQDPPPSNALVTQVEPIERQLELERSPKPGPGSAGIYQASFPGPVQGKNASARPVAATPPPYPREAAISGIEGWVRVAVDIDARGRVRDVQVLAAEPSGVFEQAAEQAVRRWTWRPAVVDGQPRAQTVVQELAFDLDGD